MQHYHKNPRQITKKQFADLQDSLKRLGDLSGVVHDLSSDEIIGGNQRMDVFDLKTAPIEIVERMDAPDAQGTVARGWVIWQGQKYTYRAVMWDEATRAEANIRANKAGGGWDFDTLANEFEMPDLLNWGFTEDELIGLDFGAEDAPKEDPGPQVDKAEELREKWQVEPGQLWQLGEHRLICGDCTDKAVVERLMGGEKAVCMWTDPPYGVEYVGKTKDALTIENDGADGLEGLLLSSFSVANDILEPGAPFYVAHPAGALQVIFLNTVVAVGWRIHEQLVWVKDSMVLGHSDYHYKHEPILYGWTPGEGRSGRGDHEGSRWHGDNSQVSVFEIPRPKRSELHPTMKPPELVQAHLNNSTMPGEIVYEPFDGSGTTLVACEQIGRICRACELSPKFVAVALERWSTMTGQTPILIEEN
jgi:DNA modification methylase